MWDVATSMWIFVGAMWTVAAFMWASTASIWAVAASKQDVHQLHWLLNKPKSPDSTAVQAFEVEAKKRKIVYPTAEKSLPSFRNQFQ